MSVTSTNPGQRDATIFERRESAVRSYCRSFPVTFVKAKDARLTTDEGDEYIDFLAGCSSLNYGHNNDVLQKALVDYITNDGLTHSLDMQTQAKAKFLETFEQLILKPRGLDYVVQFPGPTGANAVEAAMKAARKATGRHNIIAFTNGFHGCTLGALAATGNKHHRGGAGIPLQGVTRVPFDGYFGDNVDTADQLEKMLDDPSSGIDAPAAILVETVQGEGGLNAASFKWLRKIQSIARLHGALLIVDDIQAGIGRTGQFFSFEKAGIRPDIVTMAKSLSGYGLPMALTLLRRDLDLWKPGEHNGTFRGNCHAFVTATAAIETYWADNSFEKEIARKSDLLAKSFERLAKKFGSAHASVRGRGMMQGIDVKSGDLASKITRQCFENGLIIETSGAHDEVVKCLCPLTISDDDFAEGLRIVTEAVTDVLSDHIKKAA